MVEFLKILEYKHFTGDVIFPKLRTSSQPISSGNLKVHHTN